MEQLRQGDKQKILLNFVMLCIFAKFAEYYIDAGFPVLRFQQKTDLLKETEQVGTYES